MNIQDLARRIEETPIGPFAILLGLHEDHYREIVAARKDIADALRFYETHGGHQQNTQLSQE